MSAETVKLNTWEVILPTLYNVMSLTSVQQSSGFQAGGGSVPPEDLSHKIKLIFAWQIKSNETEK